MKIKIWEKNILVIKETLSNLPEICLRETIHKADANCIIKNILIFSKLKLKRNEKVNILTRVTICKNSFEMDKGTAIQSVQHLPEKK